MSKFNSIRIVLVGTTHPGNIGATARAMKTMGLNRLYLVSPKTFPDKRAYEMAAGADDVLENAIIVSTLADAIADCQLVLATSARPRDLSLPGLTPAAQAKLVAEQANHSQVAILFGREHAGLTNDELLHCHYHINIPSNLDYSSLNLAQAVQIIAYELRMHLLAPPAIVQTTCEKQATSEEIQLFLHHFQEVLEAIGFLKTKPTRLLHRLRRMFNRIRPDSHEVNILRGILTQVQCIIKVRQEK